MYIGLGGNAKRDQSPALRVVLRRVFLQRLLRATKKRRRNHHNGSNCKESSHIPLLIQKSPSSLMVSVIKA
jgi:hypothetical protein